MLGNQLQYSPEILVKCINFFFNDPEFNFCIEQLRVSVDPNKEVYKILLECLIYFLLFLYNFVKLKYYQN